MANNEKNTSIGLSQEKVDILRKVISEARNAGLDDLTIESLIFSRDTGIMASMKDWDTFTEIAERCGMGTMMSEDYLNLNPNKSYTGYSREMRDAVDGLFQEGRSGDASAERLNAYWNLRMHSKKQPEVSNTVQPEEISIEPEMETIQQPISQENTEKLRQAISEARNAGIDDRAIQSFIFSKDTGKVGHMDMETFSKWAQISNKYGISTIMGEDYLNPNKSYRGYSTEMRDAVDGLFQEGRSEEEQGYRISDYRRTHSKTQSEVSETMQPEEMPAEMEAETIQQPISQENTEKLRQAISEARNAGIDDRAIQSFIFSKDTGKVGHMDMETFSKWAQISNKYGISTIMGEDYLNPNKSYRGYSTEMRDAVDGLFQEGRSEEEQGYRISDYRRTHSKAQPEQISTEPEMETTQQPISQWQIDKLRKAIYEARRNGMDAETINKYIYPFQTVRGEYNAKEARMWGEISSKYGIPEMMHYEYFLDRKLGFRQELRDAIDSIAQEEMIEGIELDEQTTKSSKSFSLIESGKSAYQHFGKKVAEKLKEAVNAIKSKFLSKDKSQTNDLDTSR